MKLMENKTKLRTMIITIFVATWLVYLNRLRIEKKTSYKKFNIFVYQNLSPYYRMLFGRVTKLARDSLVDSFFNSNGIIKLKELSESHPLLVTHLTDLED